MSWARSDTSFSGLALNHQGCPKARQQVQAGTRPFGGQSMWSWTLLDTPGHSWPLSSMSVSKESSSWSLKPPQVLHGCRGSNNSGHCSQLPFCGSAFSPAVTENLSTPHAVSTVNLQFIGPDTTQFDSTFTEILESCVRCTNIEMQVPLRWKIQISYTNLLLEK